MKRHSFILIVLIFGILGCQTNKKEVTITGTIIGKIHGDIEYTSSENGACFWQFAKPLPIDSSGHFCLTMEIDDPVFFQLVIGSYQKSAMIIEPGLNYKIQFDLDAKDDQLSVDCINNKAQTLYRNLPLELPQNAPSNFTVYNRPIPSNIFDSINTIKEKEILRFKELLDNNEISKPFYELVKADRTCYYTAIQSSFASALYFEAKKAENETLINEIVGKWDRIFQNSPLNDSYMVNSFWFYTLATDLINLKMYRVKPAFIDSLAQIYPPQNELSFKVAIAKRLFEGKSEEYFIAQLLQSVTSTISKNEELIQLIQEFKISYPQSVYLPYLDVLQKSMAEYLKIADAPFNDKMKFLDNENINTLSECVSVFKGRKIYVDVWASWCLPCRAEFKHLENLKKLLASNDVVLLFISIDSGRFEKMWPELIKYYNLEGFHIKANPQLDGDLRRIYNNGGSMSIPWNILIDEDGQIIKLHASKPSQLGQLEKEIKKE